VRYRTGCAFLKEIDSTQTTTPLFQEKFAMQKMECPCGYVYDPAEGDYENGIAPGTAFADLPDSWVCPKCGAEKEYFYAVD